MCSANPNLANPKVTLAVTDSHTANPDCHPTIPNDHTPITDFHSATDAATF